ncbi:MAG: hypothetical protein QNJ01_13275, partial [Desulfobacterales bacterium]|nr:hypothetical protein [Desulfobacterales bacterium]
LAAFAATAAGLDFFFGCFYVFHRAFGSIPASLQRCASVSAARFSLMISLKSYEQTFEIPIFSIVHFLPRGRKRTKRRRPCPAYPARRQTEQYAAPHAAMQRCSIRSRAHNLTIAARLASLGRLA